MSGRSSGAAGVYVDGNTIKGSNTVGVPLYIDRDVLVSGVPDGTQEATDRFYVYDPELALAKKVTIAAATGVDPNVLDANSVMYAVTDNTPAALAMGASTILARLAAGNIVAATPTQLRTLLATVIPQPYAYINNFGCATGATQTLYRFYAGTFNPGVIQLGAPGKLIGLTVNQNQNRTGGTEVFTVFKNGSTTGITATIDGTNVAHITSTLGSVAFTATDTFDVRIVSTSYTGTAGNVEAALLVTFDAS